MSPRILTIDIETSPSVAHVWSLWKQTVSLSQLQESTEVISFAAKWHDKQNTMFFSEYDFSLEKVTKEKRREMVEASWALICEADVVVHYNGKSFDMPHLRREWLRAGLLPPSPVKEVDLLQVAKSRFRFTSNKLQYVSQYVGLEGKVSHHGHELWVQCMAGEVKAWKLMRKYNKNDVVITEQLYDILLPWISNHPHVGLYADNTNCCQRCGGAELVREGYAYTLLGKFQQYRCKGCSSWSRGKTNLLPGIDARGVQ